MTRSSSSTVVRPVEDPKSILHIKKNKAIRESSGKEKIQGKKVVDYEPKAPEFEEESDTELKEEMENIAGIIMEEYKKNMRDYIGQGLVQPAIPATANFELKGQILTQRKEIPFDRKDHKDAYKHINEVNDIVDYFNIPNVPYDTFLLQMLPVTFNGNVKDWLNVLSPGSITTWAKMRKEFIQQFCPPLKVSKLKKAITKSEQQGGE